MIKDFNKSINYIFTYAFFEKTQSNSATLHGSKTKLRRMISREFTEQVVSHPRLDFLPEHVEY